MMPNQPYRKSVMTRIAFATVLLLWFTPALPGAITKPVRQQPAWSPPLPTSDVDDLNERFKLVLNIGDAEADALRRDGVLRTQLPAAYKNRVGSIVLKGHTTFRDERLSVVGDVDKLGTNLIVNIDESIVDRLGYQPVVMKIYQSNFNSVVLRYQRDGNINKLASNRKFLKPAFDDSPQLFIRMSETTGTTGWIRGMKTVPVQTQFGKIDFDFRSIQGVKFNAGQPDKVVVISTAGDYVTGTTDFDEITLATRWGEESIAIKDIDSISWHRDSRFSESNSGANQTAASPGTRWLLSPVPRSNSFPLSGYRQN